jgi:hypothetical protein
VCGLSGKIRGEQEVDVARKDTNSERTAGEFLSAELIAANYVEFHQRVGETLRKCNEGELIAPDALWRIRHFHALVRKYNLNLEVQRQLFPPSSGKIGGPHREHEAGEQPDGKM